VLNLPATMTHGSRPACLSELRDGLQHEAATVVVDGERLQRFDSSALAVLLELRRECAKAGKVFAVQKLPPVCAIWPPCTGLTHCSSPPGGSSVKSRVLYARHLLPIHLQDVSLARGPKGTTFKAVDNVSLNIEEGEFFGLLGPNGAGKTTLISMLAGLSHPPLAVCKSSGSDVQSDFADARRKLGVVPQELVFDPFFNVREMLRIQSGYFGLKNNDAWVDELLEGLGLADKANANMRQLSGGMKRRVLVAQALVHKPPVIVLDEPTAGVDVELRQTLWQFVANLDEQGSTVLLTDPLSGRGRSVVRAHCHAQDRPHRGFGQNQRPAQGGQQQCVALQDGRCAAP